MYSHIERKSTMRTHISAHSQRDDEPKGPQSNHKHGTDDRYTIDRVRDHF